MPNRIIKETIKTSSKIDELSWFEEVVFYRLIVTADDYGCLDGRSVLLKNELFPTRDNVTKKAIEDAIAKLASVGLLRSYEVSGKSYLFFPSWEKHQRLRNKHRKYPAPEENAPADTCQSNDGQTAADCQSEIESNKNKNLNPNTNTNCAPASGKSAKKAYGENKRVLLTDEEHERLVKDYGEEKTSRAIEFFDSYIAEKDYKSKSHNLTLRRWVFDAIEKQNNGRKGITPVHEPQPIDIARLQEILDKV